MGTYVAVDLGATSGRVMLARVDGAGLDLVEVHRFGTEPVSLWENGRAALHWDTAELYRQVVAGLRAVAQRLRPGERLDGIGVDAWAVDYGLLGADGRLLGSPYCYRDERTGGPDGGVARVHAVADHAALYGRNGLQFLPFNTLYQLASEPADVLAGAATMLLLPDLLGYWLTGVAVAEATNASTTGLVDLRTGEWDTELCQAIGIAPRLLPPLTQPGQTIGPLLEHVASRTGLPVGTPVVAVGSHDTASAVVAVPATAPGFGYISCGTWSLVGLELAEPVLSEQSRGANFTNEGGVDGRTRYLRNVMGLWLLSESVRSWERSGPPVDLAELLRAAAERGDRGPVIDVDDPRFLPPGDMPARIDEYCRENGLPVPADRPALVRCVLDSLAQAYARAVDDAARLSGRTVDVLHIVGGGARNALLCRLTARATGRPVVAGPFEATAIGNVLVQARARGDLTGGLEQLRGLVAATQCLTRYEP